MAAPPQTTPTSSSTASPLPSHIDPLTRPQPPANHFRLPLAWLFAVDKPLPKAKAIKLDFNALPRTTACTAAALQLLPGSQQYGTAAEGAVYHIGAVRGDGGGAGAGGRRHGEGGVRREERE